MYVQKQNKEQKINSAPLQKKSDNTYCIQKMSVQDDKGGHYRMKQIYWILERVKQIQPDIDFEKSITNLLSERKKNPEYVVLLNSLAANVGKDSVLKDLDKNEELKKKYVKIDQVTMLQQTTLPNYLVGPDDYKIDALHCIAGKANIRNMYGPHIAISVKSDTIYVAINTNVSIVGNKPENFEEPIKEIKDAISSFEEKDIKKYNAENSSCSEFLNDITKYSVYKQAILDYIKKLRTKTIKRVYYDVRKEKKSVEASDKKTEDMLKIDTGKKAMHGEILIAEYLQKTLGENLAYYTTDAQKMEARKKVFETENVFRSIRIGGTKINCWNCSNHLKGPIRERYLPLKANVVTSTLFNQQKFDGYTSNFLPVEDAILQSAEHNMQNKNYEHAMNQYLQQGNQTAANKAYMLVIAQYKKEQKIESLEQVYKTVGNQQGMKELAKEFLTEAKKLLSIYQNYIKAWQDFSKKNNQFSILNEIAPIERQFKGKYEKFEAICPNHFAAEKRFLDDLDKYKQGKFTDTKVNKTQMQQKKSTYQQQEKKQRELVEKYERLEMVKNKTVKEYIES